MEPDDNIQAAPSAADTENYGTQESSAQTVASQQSADTSQSSDANDVPQASSAAETDANKRASLLDVIKGVVKAKPDANSSLAVNDKVTTEDSATGVKAVKDDASGNPKAEVLPFHNHPRWKELLSERDSFKSRAEQYDKVEQYMVKNQLSPQEVAEGFQVMSLLKHNPVEAYKVLSGHLSRLAPIVGESLPEDISRRVDNGDVDIESAKELAKARAQANLLAQQQQLGVVERQNQEYNAKQTQVRDAVMAWESNIKQRDPDYSAKQKFIMDKVRVMIGNETPNSTQEAIAMVERAYADVNEGMRSFIPRRSQTVMTSSSSSVSAQPQPKTLLDVVRTAASRY
jgi:hypothetical protein